MKCVSEVFKQKSVGGLFRIVDHLLFLASYMLLSDILCLVDCEIVGVKFSSLGYGPVSVSGQRDKVLWSADSSSEQHGIGEVACGNTLNCSQRVAVSELDRVLSGACLLSAHHSFCTSSCECMSCQPSILLM